MWYTDLCTLLYNSPFIWILFYYILQIFYILDWIVSQWSSMFFPPPNLRAGFLITRVTVAANVSACAIKIKLVLHINIWKKSGNWQSVWAPMCTCGEYKQQTVELRPSLKYTGLVMITPETGTGILKQTASVFADSWKRRIIRLQRDWGDQSNYKESLWFWAISVWLLNHVQEMYV